MALVSPDLALDEKPPLLGVLLNGYVKTLSPKYPLISCILLFDLDDLWDG